MSNNNIEYLFVDEFMKKIDEHIARDSEFVTSNLLDSQQYANFVGRIYTANALKEELTQLLRAYFPS